MDRRIRTINNVGLELIRAFEGKGDGNPDTVKLDPYMDPVGIWTIGYGHAIFVGNKPLRGKENKAAANRLYPSGLTTEEADLLLEADLHDTCRDVEACLLPFVVKDDEFAALVSLTFNIGIGAFRRSTLLRKFQALLAVGGTEKDQKEVADEFLRWNKAGGKVLRGLTRRRKSERALFLS